MCECLPNIVSCLLVILQEFNPTLIVCTGFFDNNDHDTTIITSSNAPEFNDNRTYPVQMDADLDKYVRTEVSYS